MEWLSSMVNGDNGLFALLTILVVFIIAVILMKRGYISFNGKGLRLGIQDRERSIIRSQLEYADMVLDSTLRDLPKNLQNDRGLVVISKVKDEFEKMIVFNHITDTEEYINLKQEVVHSTILKYTYNEYFKTNEFKKYSYDLTERIIKRLVKIRKQTYGVN